MQLIKKGNMTKHIEVAAHTKAKLGEGPHWDTYSQSLFWVDIDKCEIHNYNANKGDKVVARLEVPVGAVVPSSSGELIVGADRGIAKIDATGSVTWLATDLLGDRMNDGKCDPYGRFYVGSLTYDRRPGASALYCLDITGQIELVKSDVTISNGLGWSPDQKTMYFIDTPTRSVLAIDYDVSVGSLDNPRKFIDLTLEDGNPDGMTVDSEGGLWIVMCRSGTLRRYSDQGRLDEFIEFPTKLTTSCAFGGAGLDTLFVTSGTFGYPPQELSDQPLAGSIFALDPGVKGMASNGYGG